jgi:hypothetical protein
MAVSVRHPKDFISGLIFIGLGLGFFLIAQDYKMGTATRMGPAYLPTILASLLMLIGLGLVVRALFRDGDKVMGVAWKQTLLILIGTVMFGILVRNAGLVAALLAYVSITAMASVYFHWRATGLLAAGMTIFCVIIFIYALGLPIPMIGRWFSA